jgi:flagellin
MSNIVLSNGIRQNLLSLQQTSEMQSATQLRLATGRRVNSAVDNPVNFFTNASLNARANALSGLLDAMSNGIKTIESADKGISAITKLVESTQATIRQALNDAAQNRPAKTGSSLSTLPESVDANKSRKEVTLDKKLVDDNGATANLATSTYSGNLGIATATNITLSINAGNSTYTVGLTPATATVRDVVNEINKSGLATASVGDDGSLVVTGTGSDTLRIGIGSGANAAAALTDAQSGTLNTALGLAATDYTTGLTQSGNSTIRTNLVNQFNDLRTQMDQLARDAGFNGVNLLGGDKLSVVFNEKTGTGRTKLDIQGATLSAANLGIPTAVNGTASTGQFNIQNDTDLNTTMETLTGALSSLRSLASTFGSNLAVVQVRNDFTKEMVTTLKGGADNLVLADSNEEGANLLALNTRQQLSQTALSLAAQADQGVLRLFG